MKMTVLYIITTMIIIAMLMMIFKMVSHNVSFSQHKNSTFECGFDTVSSLRLPFSLNFFVVAIIFLIFDVELILLLPFIFMMKLEQKKTIYLILVWFFWILILGFIYEWWMGLLNWLV